MNMHTRGIAGRGPAAVLVALLAALAGCSANGDGGSASEQKAPQQPVKTTGGWRMARMTFKVGSGLQVSITGGGAGGRSNCTRDETVTSFTTRSNDEAHDFGFYAKGEDSCAIEKSFSYFKVVVKESNDNTVGTADVYFGEGPVLSPAYIISCADEPGQITCARDRDGVTISRR